MSEATVATASFGTRPGRLHAVSWPTAITIAVAIVVAATALLGAGRVLLIWVGLGVVAALSLSGST